MRTHFLLLLLASLFIFPIDMSSTNRNHKRRIKYKAEYIRKLHRSLFTPTLSANEVNDCLVLTFQFSLQNAEVIIKDKDNHIIIDEHQAIIPEGKEISIPNAEDYPYSIKIVSPFIEIEGEIIEEEIIEE